MEKYFYELRPFFYLSGSIYALIVSPNSTMMVTSGWVLLGCSFYIFNMRTHYRRALRLMRQQNERQKQEEGRHAA